MSIKRMKAVITSAGGPQFRCVDEHGAQFVFEAEPEHAPHVTVWQREDEVDLEEFDLRAEFSWRATRAAEGGGDRAYLRQVAEDAS